MPFTKTEFPELIVFEPEIFQDDRGYFFESYNENVFKEAGISVSFVQDNQAKSVFGVLRGLHYQLAPFAQTKLIRVLEGEILDVVVDLRKGSPSFQKYFSIKLSADNKKQLFIPKGFAHGYAVLSPVAEVMYKCDAFYHKPSEGGIIYNDLDLKIDWGIPLDRAIISEKDAILPFLKTANHNFIFKG